MPPQASKKLWKQKKYFCIHELTNISVNIREAFEKQKKPYNFCELIHFCQGLKQHHIPKQDELDTNDLSLVFNHFWWLIVNLEQIIATPGL